MKIKYLFLCIFVASISVFAEDCSYLKDPTQSYVNMDYPGSFNNEYPYQLCILNNPIHADAIEYIQGIKNIE